MGTQCQIAMMAQMRCRSAADTPRFPIQKLTQETPGIVRRSAAEAKITADTTDYVDLSVSIK